jgi:NOL1/NOP2/fmu family ribosome biogenesis protein
MNRGELQSEHGLLEELEEYGIELPKGVKVIGVKKLRVATLEAVGLSEVMGGSESIGLALGKLHGEFKPASVFLRVFPASKKVVELARAEAEEFMRGKDHRVEGRGYRVVKTGCLVLGCGFARDGVLENKVPKKEWLPRQ